MPDNDANGPRSLFDRLMQALGGGEPQDQEQLLELLRDAQRRGLFGRDALDMIEGVFEVTEMQVRDIMIPRSHMVVVEVDDPLEDMLQVISESGHSRFPAIGDSRDEVIGVLLAKDLLRFSASKTKALEFDINDYLRPAVFIPESKRLNTLLREFRSSRYHIAIVVDEYGGVAGLVTIEDVLEQIVGEIDDEHDSEEETNIREQDNGIFAVRALTPIEDFNAHFACALSDEEFDTIGGLVLQQVGQVPKRGETVVLDTFQFRVLAADSRRIHLLQVSRIEGDLSTDQDDID